LWHFGQISGSELIFFEIDARWNLHDIHLLPKSSSYTRLSSRQPKPAMHVRS
jgi:hypothetical protein